MMLVATQSFAYVDPFDGERKAVHRGRTRIAEDHELARRFPLRFEPVNRRAEAAARFRHVLDQADTYNEYRSTLDALTARLELVERMGEARCGRQSTTHLLPMTPGRWPRLSASSPRRDRADHRDWRGSSRP
jgi:hypothetical protein